MGSWPSFFRTGGTATNSDTVTTVVEMWVEGQWAPHFKRIFGGAGSRGVARVVGGPEWRAHIRRHIYYLVEA